MRALTIRQPWASLILSGKKKIETRSTRTKRRGTVFLHAGTVMGKSEREAAIREGLDPDTLPRGMIIGTIEIVDSVPAKDLNVSDAERSRGDFRPGRWGWVLGEVRALAKPVPATGALSFWKVSKEIERATGAQPRARVFVYGTLKRGFWNHRLLSDGRACFIGRDRVKGQMHSLGAFPSVALTTKGTVHGEVYEVTADTLARLDLIEGVPRFYQRTRVRMSTGMEAWIYNMEPERLAGRERVPSGCWEEV